MADGVQTVADPELLGTRIEDGAPLTTAPLAGGCGTTLGDDGAGPSMGRTASASLQAIEEETLAADEPYEQDEYDQSALDAAFEARDAADAVEAALDEVRQHPIHGRVVDEADRALVVVLVQQGVSYEAIVNSLLNLPPGAAASQDILPTLLSFLTRRYSSGAASTTLPVMPPSPLVFQSPSEYAEYQPTLPTSASVAAAPPLLSSGASLTAAYLQAPLQQLPPFAAGFAPPPSQSPQSSPPVPYAVLESGVVHNTNPTLPTSASVAAAPSLLSSGAAPPAASPQQTTTLPPARTPRSSPPLPSGGSPPPVFPPVSSTGPFTNSMPFSNLGTSTPGLFGLPPSQGEPAVLRQPDTGQRSAAPLRPEDGFYPSYLQVGQPSSMYGLPSDHPSRAHASAAGFLPYPPSPPPLYASEPTPRSPSVPGTPPPYLGAALSAPDAFQCSPGFAPAAPPFASESTLHQPRERAPSREAELLLASTTSTPSAQEAARLAYWRGTPVGAAFQAHAFNAMQRPTYCPPCGPPSGAAGSSYAPSGAQPSQLGTLTFPQESVPSFLPLVTPPQHPRMALGSLADLQAEQDAARLARATLLADTAPHPTRDSAMRVLRASTQLGSDPLEAVDAVLVAPSWIRRFDTAVGTAIRCSSQGRLAESIRLVMASRVDEESNVHDEAPATQRRRVGSAVADSSGTAVGGCTDCEAAESLQALARTRAAATCAGQASLTSEGDSRRPNGTPLGAGAGGVGSEHPADCLSRSIPSKSVTSDILHPQVASWEAPASPFEQSSITVQLLLKFEFNVKAFLQVPVWVESPLSRDVSSAGVHAMANTHAMALLRFLMEEGGLRGRKEKRENPAGHNELAKLFMPDTADTAGEHHRNIAYAEQRGTLLDTLLDGHLYYLSRSCGHDAEHAANVLLKELVEGAVQVPALSDHVHRFRGYYNARQGHRGILSVIDDIDHEFLFTSDAEMTAEYHGIRWDVGISAVRVLEQYSRLGRTLRYEDVKTVADFRATIRRARARDGHPGTGDQSHVNNVVDRYASVGAAHVPLKELLRSMKDHGTAPSPLPPAGRRVGVAPPAGVHVVVPGQSPSQPPSPTEMEALARRLAGQSVSVAAAVANLGLPEDRMRELTATAALVDSNRLPEGPLKLLEILASADCPPELKGRIPNPLWNTERTDGKYGKKCFCCHDMEPSAEGECTNAEFKRDHGSIVGGNTALRKWIMVHQEANCRNFRMRVANHVRKHPTLVWMLEKDPEFEAKLLAARGG